MGYDPPSLNVRKVGAATTVYGLGTTTADTLTIYANLTDATPTIKLVGNEYVYFGTYSAGAATDSTGYITIKDAAGTVRKLMVQA